MKSRFIWINSLLIAGISFSTLAEESSVAAIEQLENPWFVAVGFGITDVGGEINEEGLFTLGRDIGYRFNKNIGVKYGDYIGKDIAFGFLRSDRYSFKFKYLALTARTESDIHVFASLGYARVKENLEIDTGTLTERSNEVFWEAGAGWDFSKHFGTTISYQQNSAELADLSTLMFKIKMQF